MITLSFLRTKGMAAMITHLFLVLEEQKVAGNDECAKLRVFRIPRVRSLVVT